MRKALIVVVSIVAILLVVAVALPFLVNANQFRPQIQAKLKESLHRSVEIGNLSVSLLAGGISAENVSIAEDPAYGTQPFLKAQALEVGVEFIPLIFSHSLHVNSITLRQPELRLIRGAGSHWNFSSLSAPPSPASAARPHEKSAAPAASSASTDAALSIGSLRIIDGRVTMANISNLARAQTYDKIQFKAQNIGYDNEIPFSLSANMPGGGALKLEGTAGPIDRADAAATPLETSISVQHMDVAASGLLDPASGLAGILDYEGTVKSDGKTAHTEGKLGADNLRLVKGGAPARQHITFDYATSYDVKREAGVLNRGTLHFASTSVGLSGNYLTQAANTVVHIKVNGNNLPVNDIEGLLPALGVVLPPGSSLQGGTVTANLSLDGPLDRLVVTGPLNVSNTRITNFNLASKMSALATLAGLHGGTDTDIQTLSSGLRVAPDGIQAENINLVIPSLGSVTGAGTIAANNALNFRMVAKLNPGTGAGVAGGAAALTGVLGKFGKLSSLGAAGAASGTIPFMIQGTTSNPVFIPDVGRVLGNTLSAKPQQGQSQGLGGILGGLFKKPH